MKSLHVDMQNQYQLLTYYDKEEQIQLQTPPSGVYQLATRTQK